MSTIQNEQKHQRQQQELLFFKTKQERVDLVERIQNYLTSKFAVSCGRDTNENNYESLMEFWNDRGLLLQNCEEEEKGLGRGVENVEQSRSKNNNTTPMSSSLTSSWYEASHNFWENQTNAPATVDGMLGGFSVLSDRDLAASRDFVEHILQFRHLNMNLKMCQNQNQDNINSNINDNTSNTINTSRSCECGAGIGRITKGLMLPLGISSCDLVETSPRLIECAKDYIGQHDVPKCNFLCCGLQDFYPGEDKYDIIWIQWVVGYLTDWDLVSFLSRMGRALRHGGIIVVKDNTCNELAFLADCNDSDITRSFKYLMAIVEQSGLRVLQSPDGKQLIKWQEDFPDDIWPVPMICLTRY